MTDTFSSWSFTRNFTIVTCFLLPKYGSIYIVNNLNQILANIIMIHIFCVYIYEEFHCKTGLLHYGQFEIFEI